MAIDAPADFLLDPIAVGIAPLDMSSVEVLAWYKVTDHLVAGQLTTTVATALPTTPQAEEEEEDATTAVPLPVAPRQPRRHALQIRRDMLLARERELDALLQSIVVATCGVSAVAHCHDAMPAMVPMDVVEMVQRAAVARQKYGPFVSHTHRRALNSLVQWSPPRQVV